MITELLKALPDTLEPYCPAPRALERAPWEALSPTLQSKLILSGEDCLKYKFPSLSATDFLAFSRSGNRSRYEKTYFAKRRTLCILIMAEYCEYKSRFLDAIVNGIWSICEESAWQLPAHNSYIRDTPSHPLPDTARPVLDLFACETAALLSVAQYLLKASLQSVSPLICKRINKELEHRIIKPYTTEHFWWMGNGDESMCNWTPWCTQNILLTVFCTPQSDSTRRKALTKAAYSLDCFLKDYADDGCCNEGAQYYRHAGLCLFGALDVLCAVAPTAFIPVWQEEKVKNIAEFIVHMHVDGAYYINFADCSPIAGNADTREFLFGKRVSSPALMQFAANFYAKPASTTDGTDGINLFYLLQRVFTGAELCEYPKQAIAKSEFYYPSVGVFIARDERYTLAVKAGNNADNHNHNDTGSFTLYKNGKPFLIDIGVETYSKKTFSKDRYDIWTMQSAWHNLPTFDGIMQKDGAEYCASEVQTAFGNTESRISMQLAKAWPRAANLNSFTREITLHKGERVCIKDVCTGVYSEAFLSLMLCEKPCWSGNALEISNTGKIIISCGIPEIGRINITDKRLRLTWPSVLYRVMIPFKNTVALEIE